MVGLAEALDNQVAWDQMMVVHEDARMMELHGAVEDKAAVLDDRGRKGEFEWRCLSRAAPRGCYGSRMECLAVSAPMPHWS